MNRSFVAVAIILFFAAIYPSVGLADTPGVTMSNYNRLKTGMTYLQAVQILGKEGTEMSSTELGGTKAVMYMWKADGLAGVTGGNMNAMFDNGKLVSKAQMGLR